MLIPKIIHQIWIGPKKIPHDVINTVKNDFMREYQDFEYILWDENKIEVHKKNFKLYPLYQLCQTYSGIANLIRLDILYNFGGIYIDADTIYTKNNINFRQYLESENSIIISKSPDNKCFPNGFIGCTQYNNLFKEMINDLVYDFVPYVPSCESCGPHFITRYMKKNLDDITIMPTKLIYPTNWHNNNQQIMDNIETIREKYKDSLFFQIGFTTCNIVIENDIHKEFFYKCLNNSNVLFPFESMDEYIITPSRKNIIQQLAHIKNESKKCKIKKPIIYIDERLCNVIRNNYYDLFTELIENCELGFFVHLGSRQYLNLENLNSSLTSKLNMFCTSPKYLLVYCDPYRSKIKFDNSLSKCFEKIKIVSRNSKILNSYFIR